MCEEYSISSNILNMSRISNLNDEVQSLSFYIEKKKNDDPEVIVSKGALDDLRKLTDSLCKLAEILKECKEEKEEKDVMYL